MEWMFIDAYCVMFYGPSQATGAVGSRGHVGAVGAAGAAGFVGTEAPSEIDLWLTQRAYEFAAENGTCGKCSAGFGRKVRLAAVFDLRERDGTPWRIGVEVRCRGWRRHRHTALVTESRGGLRFEPLRPG